MPIKLISLIALLLCLGCTNKEDSRWKAIKNSRDIYSLKAYLLETPEPTHFNAALQQYFILQDSIYNKSAIGCFINRDRNIEITVDSLLITFNNNPTTLQQLTGLCTTYLNRTTTPLHDSTLMNFTDADSIKRNITKIAIIINLNQTAPYNTTSSVFLAVQRSLMHYRDSLTQSWYHTSYKNTAPYRQAVLDTALYSKLRLFNIVPPPPPPLPVSF